MTKSSKLQRNTKLQAPTGARFDVWCLVFIWSLELGVWCFVFLFHRPLPPLPFPRLTIPPCPSASSTAASALVEEAWTNHPVTLRVLREYLRPLLRHPIDPLMLGGTHYPLLKDAIHEVTKEKLFLVESAESCALYVKERLAVLKLLSANRRPRGMIQPF